MARVKTSKCTTSSATGLPRNVNKRSAQSLTAAQMAQYFLSRQPQSEVSNPYATVAAVNACVRKKADAMAMLPLRVSTVNDDVIESGPITEAVERPNSGMTSRAFRRALSAYLDLFGKVYIVKFALGNTLSEYFPVAPLEMSEQRGSNGVIGYVYTPLGAARGQTMNLSVDQVHVITDPDFGCADLTKELSPRRAVALAISQHYQADIANDRSLTHGAGGGLALKTPGNLSDPQKKDLNAVLDERYSGAANRHRWMLLEGGLSVEKLFSTFSEMEFTELKYFSREDICVGFGVNPLVIGYSGREGLGSGQHTDAAHLIFWTDTIMPRAEWLAEEIGEALGKHFEGDKSLTLRDARRRKFAVAERRSRIRRELAGRATARNRQYYFWFDFGGVPVLQRHHLAMADQAQKWVAVGVPLNQILAASDLPFEDVPWGNTWWRPFGLVDVQDPDKDMPGAADPAGPPPEDGDDDAPADDSADEGKAAPGDVATRLTDEQSDGLWAAHRASWAPLEKEAARRHNNILREARKETLQNLERLLPEGKQFTNLQRRNVIGQILFNISVVNGKLVASVGPILRQANKLGGDQSMKEAAVANGHEDKPDPYSIQDPNAVKAMAAREVRLKGTTDTTRRKIAESLAEGIEKSETTAQLSDRIKKEFNLASDRANTTARTEVGGAVEDGKQTGRIQAGIPLKSWLWSKKETGRPWHRATEEATRNSPIPAAELFTIAETGNRALYPKANDLPAKDSVNCGCSTLNRYPDRRDGVLIAHLVTKGFLRAGGVEGNS